MAIEHRLLIKSNIIQMEQFMGYCTDRSIHFEIIDDKSIYLDKWEMTVYFLVNKEGEKRVWESDMCQGDFLYMENITFRLGKNVDFWEEQKDFVLSYVFDALEKRKQEALFLYNTDTEMCYFKPDGSMQLADDAFIRYTKLVEHAYYVRKYSWGVWVKFIAEHMEMDAKYKNNAIQVAEGLWITFAETPLLKKEKFCQEDMPYFVKGLQIVQQQIKENSQHQNTLIVIQSIQFNPCDFQEEGLTALIIEWAAKVFQFEPPAIDVRFVKSKNRYIFDFEVKESQ